METGTVKESKRVPRVPAGLSWVDEFISRVKPYIFVRLEDNLLIKRPNNAQKLNSTGARILKALLDGATIDQVLKRAGDDSEKTAAISNFMLAVRQSLDGSLDEFSGNPSVDVIPFDMKFSDYPVLSEIALTYRCNLKCDFCYAGCNCTANPARSSNEMKAGEIERSLRKLFHEAKVPSVSFTGGEPLLVPELPRFVSFAKKLGMRVNLITNGTLLTQQAAEELAAAGLDSAQVSIEGVTSGTHDLIVHSRGAFERSVAGVKYLKGAGIFTHTNTTITRANLEECLAFPQFVREGLGNSRFSMNLIIPIGSAALNDRLVVRYSDIGEHLEAILEESERYNVEFMWYSPVPMCMFNSIPYGLGNKGCSACDGLISIAPNGDVLPCASYDDSVGNLLKEDFESIWQSVKARKYREKSLAHSECRKCDKFHICNGACPLYWRQMGFKELREVFVGNSKLDV